MCDALQAESVKATILSRRDDFASPEMRWLVACLKQINRPLDRRNLATLVETFNSFAPKCAAPALGGTVRLDSDDVLQRSATEVITYLSAWLDATRAAGPSSPAAQIVNVIARLNAGELKLATPFHKSFAMITLRSWNQACGAAFRAFFLCRLGWTTSLRTPPGEASTPSRSWIARCQDSACVALRACSMRPSAWRKTAVTRCWPARRRRSVVQLAVSPPARRRCRSTGTSWQASTDRHRRPALRAGLRWWIGRGPSALPRERRTASRSVRVTQVRHSRPASQPTL